MSRSTNVSPFAADSARKSGSKPELSAESSPLSGSREAATRIGQQRGDGIGGAGGGRSSGSRSRPARNHAAELAAERRQLTFAKPVLNALGDAGQRMLSAMLETGEWQVEGNELVIKVASSATVIEMSLGADAKRLIIATASGVLGRPVRLKVVSGRHVPQSCATKCGHRPTAAAAAAPNRIRWSAA